MAVAWNVTVLIHSHRSHQCCFQMQQAGSHFQPNSCDKPNAQHLIDTKWYTDKVSDELVNTAEHLALKEPDISLRPKPKLKGSECQTYIHQVNMNGSVAICMLDM